MKNIEVIDFQSKDPVVGNVKYGTVITGVRGNPDSIYMKVDKYSVGAGLKLHFKHNTSVLVNLKTGALRAIDGNASIIILEEEVKLKEVKMTSNAYLERMKDGFDC